MRFLEKRAKGFLDHSKMLLPAGAAAAAATILAVAWCTQPDRLAQGYCPEQPVSYSHRMHAGTLRIPCLHCHTGARKSRMAGIPSVEKCMNCHRVTRTESPDIQKLNAVYRSGEPLRWARVYALPDHVYFDHRPHVHCGVACRTCHGEVEAMSIVSRTMPMRMAYCLGCHRAPGGGRGLGDPPLVSRTEPPGSGAQKSAEHCAACHR